MLARFPRRPILMLVGSVALVITLANPAAAPPGDLDTSFDGDGKVTTDFDSGLEVANAVAIQSDAKIVAAGLARTGNDDFALTRYNTDGSLDTAFDTDGKLTTSFGGTEAAQAVAIQTDGKILAVGSSCCLAASYDFALARYNPDGSLDTTFDTDGRVITDFAGDAEQAFALALQSDGKIVVAGATVISGANDFALARYNTDGSLDTTFDADGKVTTDFAGMRDFAHGVALQGDGKIVAVGFTGPVCGDCDFALARYNTDGSLDTTFDTDGKVTTDFAATNDAAFDVALQADGRIVAAGRALTGCPSGLPVCDLALARYNPDGSLDGSFDGDGKVTTDFAGSIDEAHGISVQGNGKIVVAGLAYVSSTSVIRDFALARYNTNGSLDTTFSGDGKVTTDFAGGDDTGADVAIQANGRIVAAGGATIDGNIDFALARYTCLRRTSRPMSIPICP